MTVGSPQSARRTRRTESCPLAKSPAAAERPTPGRAHPRRLGAAFSVIVERYRAPLIAYCRRLLGPDDAEDALQQTLVNALGALRRDDRAIELRPWLYRIAHNVAVNTLRRSGRHYEQLDEQYDGVPQPPDLFDQKMRLRAGDGIDRLRRGSGRRSSRASSRAAATRRSPGTWTPPPRSYDSSSTARAHGSATHAGCSSRCGRCAGCWSPICGRPGRRAGRRSGYRRCPGPAC